LKTKNLKINIEEEKNWRNKPQGVGVYTFFLLTNIIWPGVHMFY